MEEVKQKRELNKGVDKARKRCNARTKKENEGEDVKKKYRAGITLEENGKGKKNKNKKRERREGGKERIQDEKGVTRCTCDGYYDPLRRS